MQFLEIEFLKFGCFTDTRLDLGPAGPRLHVIHGPNEAGKSTALRGLTDFLYGIPNRSTDNFLHKNTDLRIGARLLDDDGREHRLIRRKGNKETLLNSAGKAVDESRLEALLHGVPREVFETEFRLDHPLMVQGGDELREGKGDLASSLFQAGAGVLGVQRLQQELGEEAERLFKRRGSTQELNKAIELWKERQGRRREAMFLVTDWKNLNQQVAQKTQERKQVTEEHTALATERQRLERYQQALRLVTGYRQKQAELAALPQRQLVSPAAREARARASQVAAEAQRKIAELQVRQNRRQQELAGLPESGSLLADKPEIEALQQQIGSYEIATRDLSKLQQQLQDGQADNRNRLENLTEALSVEEAARLRPTAAQRATLEKLLRSRTQLDTRLEELEKQRRHLESEVRQLEAEVAATASLPDPLPLRSLLKRIASEGNLSAMNDEVVRELAQAERRLQGGLSQLHPWQGTIAELEFLPTPTTETIDTFDTEFRNLASDRQRLDGEHRRLQRGLDDAEQELQQLAAQGDVPTEADLLAARQRRDGLWSRIRIAWTDGVAPGEKATRQDPEENTLRAEELESAIAVSDDIADRLRREADRVARQATLLANRDRLTRESNRLREEQQALSQTAGELSARWLACWAPCRFEPRSPAEMRSWLTHHRAMQQLARQQAEGLVRQADLENRLERQVQQIAEELQRLQETIPTGRSVPQLLEYGTGVVERLEARQLSRVTAGKQRERFERDLTDLIAAEQQERERQARWLGEWGEFVRSFPVSSNDPEDLRTLFATLEAVAHNVAEQESLRRRIEDMRQHIRQVSAVAQRLARMHLPEFGPEFGPESPARIAKELNERVARAGRAAGQRSQLEEDLSEAREHFAAVEAQRAQAAAELGRLARQAGCQSEEELASLESESVRIEALQQELEGLRTELSHTAAGRDLDEFIHEVALLNADQIPVRLDELQRQLHELDERRTQLSQELGQLQGELTRHTTGSLASDAEQEAREALAAIRPLAEQYARLRLAQGLLRRHLEAYRQQNQDPVLERATILFSRLTNGAFEGIKPDYDEKDRKILKGVRNGGDEVEIAGLSAGTRDQLFLALRLASLERQLASSARVPLIVDDILINFDDHRSRSTLAVLAEFAAQTQVLFLTHHPRLVDLAREAVPADQLQVHELRH